MITTEKHNGVEFRTVKIEGQIFAGLGNLAELIGMSRQGVKTLLHDMRKTHEITVLDLGRRAGLRVCIAEFLAALADTKLERNKQ